MIHLLPIFPGMGKLMTSIASQKFRVVSIAFLEIQLIDLASRTKKIAIFICRIELGNRPNRIKCSSFRLALIIGANRNPAALTTRRATKLATTRIRYNWLLRLRRIKKLKIINGKEINALVDLRRGWNNWIVLGISLWIKAKLHTIIAVINSDLG